MDPSRSMRKPDDEHQARSFSLSPKRTNSFYCRPLVLDIFHCLRSSGGTINRQRNQYLKHHYYSNQTSLHLSAAYNRYLCIGTPVFMGCCCLQIDLLLGHSIMKSCTVCPEFPLKPTSWSLYSTQTRTL